MPFRIPLPSLALLALLGSASAQAGLSGLLPVPPSAAKAKQAQSPAEAAREKPTTLHTLRGACSEAASRELFSACDVDGDDRLDVFEASDALDAVRDPRDCDGFARLDRDRDGFIGWAEFDASLRAVLQRGDSWRVRTSRPFVAPVAPKKPSNELQKLVQAHDANQNGMVDFDELAQFAQGVGLPPAASAVLRSLDVDHDGRLAEPELAPWFQQLDGMRRLLAPAAAPVQLPEPWQAADRDGDSRIDAAELATVLRRLDPTLARWAAVLLRAFDHDRDDKLQPSELPGVGDAADGTTAQAPTRPPLPVRAPLR